MSPTNILRLIALIAVVSIGLDLYDFVRHHHVTWLAVMRVSSFAVFLTFYIKNCGPRNL